MKLCVDCKHFVGSSFGSPEDMCGLVRDPVRGRPANTASYMRAMGSCGPGGLKFVQKDDERGPWWARR
jgi:hypothetical protein